MGGVAYLVRHLLRVGWRSAALAAVTTAVVGALVLTLLAGALRTASAPDRFVEARPTRYDVTLEQEGGEPLTAEVAALPSVTSIASATFFFGGLVPAGAEEPVEGITFVGDPAGIGNRLVDGRAASPDSAREFVATRPWLDAAGAEVGDRFRLITVSAEAAAAQGFDAEPDGPTVEATLVGVIGGTADLQESFPLAVFPDALLDLGAVGLSGSQAQVELAPGATVGDLRRELDGMAGGDLVGVGPIELVPDALRRAVATEANALLVIATIVAGAGLVVSTQVTLRVVRSPSGQRRALSSLGLTRSQLRAETLARVAGPALVGGLMAVALAVAASGLFPRGVTTAVEPEPGRRFEGWVHGPAVVLLATGLVATVAVLLAVTDRPSRVRASSAGPGFAGRLPWPRAAMGIRFTLARATLDAGTMGTPLAGLIALVVVLVAAATFAVSLDDLVDQPERQGFPFDLATGQGGQAELGADAQRRILADADVEGVTLLGTTAVDIGGLPLDVTGFEPLRGSFDLTVLSGTPPAAPDEIGLGRQAARDLDVAVGDEVVARTSTGQQRLEVSGVVVVPGVEGGDGLGEGGVVTSAGFRALEPGHALTASGISVRDGADVDAVADRLAEATSLTVGGLDRPEVVVNLRRVRSAPYVIVGLLAALVAVSVVNLMLLTLRRRRRDLAVVRALGADRRWIAGVEHAHAATVAGLVSAVGLPLGVVAGGAVFRLLADQIGAADQTATAWWALVGVGVALFVLADVVAQLVALAGRRVPPRLAAE